MKKCDKEIMSRTQIFKDLETVSSDEILQRYNIFFQEKNDRKELNYSGRTEKLLPRILVAQQRTQGLLQGSTSRYFKTFYDSFSHLEEKKTKELLKCVERGEAELRCVIAQMENESFATICRSMPPFLLQSISSLLLINSLHPLDAESVSRKAIYHDYYRMLIEATCKQETICRRVIAFAVEPKSRGTIEANEPSDWIAARRKQVDREEAMRTGKNIQAHKKTLEFLKWYEQQQNQIFLFERGELEERVNIERLERVQAGIIVDLFLEHFREIAYRGCVYLQGLRKLGKQDTRKLTMEESEARSEIMFNQYENFKMIKGKEVQNYLHTRRNVLINERVARPLH